MAVIPVIIINWNGFEDTVECVDSLLTQSYPDIIIHLVDNNSDNNEFDLLSNKYSDNRKITLHKNEENIGFTLASNKILKECLNNDYSYVALLNNDAVADNKWIENLVGTAIEEDSEIVACKMLKYYKRDEVDSKGLFLLNSGEIMPDCHGKQDTDKSKESKIIGACGGACLIKIDMLKEIGLFDTYFSTGYEDAEIGLRAFISGKKISYADSAVVFHKISKSVLKVTDEKKIQKIQRDINYTYLKLMPASIILVNFLPNLLRSIVIVILHLLSFRFRFLKNYLIASIKTCTKDLNLIIRKRKEFEDLRKLSFYEISHFQRFFLMYDMARFVDYFLGRRKNKFEIFK